MDVPRKGAARTRLLRRIGFLTFGLLIVSLLLWGLPKIRPAAPTVERSTVWVDTVKKGSMIRQVRGIGTLVPEEVLWLPALTEGRVDRINIRPGASVTPDTIVMELSNPELELEASSAEWQVRSAEAGYRDLTAKLKNQKLDQLATAARVASELEQAKLNAEVERKLGEQGLTSDVKVKTTKAIADELLNRAGIEREKVSSVDESTEAQLATQKVEIEKVRAEYELKRRQVTQLKIRAGVLGVLQQLGATQAAPVEVGQHVAAGAILARIVQPSRLKAELKIAETQAKDILIGQP